MTKLHNRLYAYRRRRAIRNYVITQVKKQLMRLCSTIVILAILCSMTGHPAAMAYFTGETKRSDTLALIITRDPENAEALIQFLDGFIVEEGSILIQDKTSQTFSTSSLTLQEPLIAADTSISTSEIISEPDTLKALICMENGFNAADLYIPSLELHYQGNSALALAGEINQEGNLLAEFDRGEIAAWFEDSTEQIEQVTFDVTGDGYEEGIYPFHFVGLGTINFAGSYETKNTEILGPAGFLTPEDGVPVSKTYRLANQDGTLLEGAAWALETPCPGVEIDEATGSLTVSGDAAEGYLIMTAIVERESRVHKARKTIAVCDDPGLAIDGADQIQIPYSGECANATYELSTQNGVKVDNITWEIAESVAGVNVEQNGTVMVDGTAAEGNFTLVALATLKGIPLSAETTVVLENMPAPVVSAVPPVTTTDTLLIDGADLILIPKEGETGTFTYSANDLDGNSLVGVNWILTGETDGVTLEGSTLTIVNTAPGGMVTLEATLVTDNEDGSQNLLSGKKNITLAFQEPTTVEIAGPELIIIPAPGPDGELVEESSTYTATVLDQLGHILEGEEVTWELTEQIPGLSFDAGGVLIVSSEAQARTVTLLAGLIGNTDVFGTLTIELAGGEAEPPVGGWGAVIGDDEAIKEDEVADDGLVEEEPVSGDGDGTGDDSNEVEDPTPKVGDSPAGEDDVTVPSEEDTALEPGEGDDVTTPVVEDDPLDGDTGEQDATETGEQPVEDDLTKDAAMSGEEDAVSQPGEENEVADPGEAESVSIESEGKEDTGADEQPADDNDAAATGVDDTGGDNSLVDSPDTGNDDTDKDLDTDDVSDAGSEAAN